MLVVFFMFFTFMALSAILMSNPVLSVLFLMLVFILGSGLTFVLGLDYLGVLLLMIYVGAISVLFLFVVMLLNISLAELNQSLFSYWWLGCLVGGIFMVQLFLLGYFYWEGQFVLYTALAVKSWSELVVETSNIEIVGEVLYLYVYDMFLVSSILLLVAIMGPVYISSMEEDAVLTSKMAYWKQVIRKRVEDDFVYLGGRFLIDF